MSRIALGLAALSLAALTACGNPGGTPTAPSLAPTTETASTPPATAAATPDQSPSPTPSATPTSTATPTGTASATPSPGTEPVTLPERVESFVRTEQRSEDDVQIGAYYSDSLKAVIEVRMAPDTTASELVESMGGTNPTTIGPALCSTQGDTICAQERAGLGIAVASKVLPASMVANLTTAFGDAAT